MMGPTAFCLQSRRSPNMSHIPTTSILVGRQGLEPCLALYKNAVLTHTPTPVNNWRNRRDLNLVAPKTRVGRWRRGVPHYPRYETALFTGATWLRHCSEESLSYPSINFPLN